MNNVKVALISADADVLKKLGEALGVDLVAAVNEATEATAQPVALTDEVVDLDDLLTDEEEEGCDCDECACIDEEPVEETYYNDSFGIVERQESDDSATELTFNLENVDPESIAVVVEDGELVISAVGFGGEALDQRCQFEDTDNSDEVYADYDQDSERLTVAVTKKPAPQGDREINVNFW